MKVTAISIAVIAALMGTSAFAADLARQAPPPTPPPAPAPVYSWTGWYVGLNGGGGWGHSKVSYTPNDPTGAAFIGTNGNDILGDSFKSSGALGGFQVGYNYQFNRNWLVGFEADADLAGIRGSGGTQYFGGLEFSSSEERINSFGTVRGRLGYLPTDNLLAYVTGGFAYDRVKRSAAYFAANGGLVSIANGGFSVNCFSPPTSACYAGSSEDVATGWTLGGGLEYALGQMWTVKAEYLHFSMNSQSLTQLAPAPNAGTAPSSLNAIYRTNFDIVRAGLNYQFH